MTCIRVLLVMTLTQVCIYHSHCRVQIFGLHICHFAGAGSPTLLVSGTVSTQHCLLVTGTLAIVLGFNET